MDRAVALNRPRLLIVDDHQIVIEGLIRLLGEGFDIVATRTDGREVVEDVCRIQPDLMLVDLWLPYVNGLEIISQLNARQAPVKSVILTMHAEASVAVESLRQGASAYVLKQSSGRELLKALQVVRAGGTYLAPQITKDAVLFMMRGVEPKRAALSARQQQILRLLARGQRAKEVAAAVGMSARAVEAMKYRIMRLLGVRSTAELIRYTLDHQLLSSSDHRPS